MVALLTALPCLLTAVTMAQGSEAPVVRRASHIALIRIVSARPGEWQPAPRQTKTRNVELRVRVEKVLKGDMKLAETAIAISQTEPSGPMAVAVPGVWSQLPIDSSAGYVVFGRSGTLAEADTLSVRPMAEALADVELALMSDAKKWTLLRSVEHAGGKPLGAVFTEYATARLPEVLFGDFKQFDGLMALLEKGRPGGHFSRALLEATYSRFLLNDPAPPRFVGRLAAGSLRMMMGQDLMLRTRLLEGLLPNLVGIEGGATKKPAAEVLSNYLADVERVKAFLQATPGNASTRLLHWLR